MHIMNNYLNIECTSVPSIECNHMWNKIKIDGKWYNVDVTADDPTPNMSTYTNHSSFLLSDEDIKTVSPSLHSVWNDTQWDGTPAITAESDDYNDSVVRSASNVAVMDGKIYCFDSDNNLCTLDAENNTLTPVYTASTDYIWFVYGNHYPCYKLSYSAIVTYNNKLYFN